MKFTDQIQDIIAFILPHTIKYPDICITIISVSSNHFFFFSDVDINIIQMFYYNYYFRSK